MTPPAVTIAIPFHDEHRRLPGAIASVLAQSFTDFELLLVDDGSRDDSLAIARRVRDPRVTVITDGRRVHLAARLNEVARRARAPLVARMDADDVCHPERLARQIARLRDDPSCDAVGTWAALVDDHDVLLGISESADLPASPRVALERGLLAHATMVARREWLLANPYDERLTRAEDRDLWCRTVRTARFGVIREPLYVVRIEMREAEFVRKYVESQRQNRELFSRYGPAMVGSGRALRLRALSHAKSVVFRTAVATGLAARLVRRRGRPPTVAERRLVDEALRSSVQRA
jgi:glycosyltransferase involved in cell wall biosynthesis